MVLRVLAVAALLALTVVVAVPVLAYELFQAEKPTQERRSEAARRGVSFEKLGPCPRCGNQQRRDGRACVRCGWE
jgi:hypothetical protein